MGLLGFEMWASLGVVLTGAVPPKKLFVVVTGAACALTVTQLYLFEGISFVATLLLLTLWNSYFGCGASVANKFCVLNTTGDAAWSWRALVRNLLLTTRTHCGAACKPTESLFKLLTNLWFACGPCADVKDAAGGLA